ncbi:ABC transporter permease [Halomicroarcula limicola]|uniref:ABC transporter permease n=1 Tax=Haloarcula limicola TaxID=1429915 RepID=A0A8J7Y3P2_9EURY|nr:ABC transporter permease [Halomicroarcula limicola]MBV0923437.1 ABC transporter permease [Halomicroarcula limicola]
MTEDGGRLRRDAVAVYGLWKRDIVRFWRAKSRVVGLLLGPFFILVFFGFGFSDARFGSVPSSLSYLEYLVPGILGFTMLFSASFTGLAVLSDREVGFLKEILVAPVSRTAIVVGRIAGGATTTMLQALLILVLAIPLGFRPASLAGVLVAVSFLVLVAATFIGLGLAIASQFKDTQGYNLIVNFALFPLAFLSGAFYPLSNLPLPLRLVGYLNPLTYGVDGLRGALVGYSERALVADFGAMVVAAAVTVALGAALFRRVEAV